MTLRPKVVGAVGTAWYLFGATQFARNFVVDVPSEVAAGRMTEDYAAAFLGIPAVIWALYGLAVLLGILGGLQTFRLRSYAWVLFGAALACDVIYFGWIRFVAYTMVDRPAEAGILAVVVLTVGMVLTLLSRWSLRG